MRTGPADLEAGPDVVDIKAARSQALAAGHKREKREDWGGERPCGPQYRETDRQT